jgi:hypothetical protein
VSSIKSLFDNGIASTCVARRQLAVVQYHDVDISDACAIQKFSADFVKPVFNHIVAPVLGEKS